MSLDPIDYNSIINQNRLNTTQALLGGNNNTIAGIPTSVLEQWNSLGANSKALKKIQEAEKNGGVLPQENHYTDLLSDKLFNDYYDTKTSTVKKATYQPDPTTNPTVDKNASAADNLDSMRRLALAAISKPDSLNSFHYDMFDKLRQTIADNLVTSGKSTTTPTTTEDPEAAKVSKSVGDFRLLMDDQSFTVAGNAGEKTYNFSTGDSIESIAAAINADTAETGVKAEVTKGEDGNYTISMMSDGTGKDAFVKVTQKTGDLFGESGSVLSANGKDGVTKEAEVVDTGDSSTAAVAAGLYGGKALEDMAFTIDGARGGRDYAFEKGTSAEDIVAAINADTEATGVKAEVIYNSLGEAEGIGLLADKAGSNSFIKVKQTEGALFAQPGKSIKVTGASSGSASDEDGPGIGSLSDLGKVVIDNVTYSFADLGPGGSASLAKNPDAALAVIDQALKDIYEGRAQVKGFDPADQPMVNMPSSASSSAKNTLEVGNFGSSAITDWVDKWTKDIA